MRVRRVESPVLLAITVAVALFTVLPMLVSISAGLVNNYAVGLASGLTTRWLAEVWASYGATAWHSVLLALACVGAALLAGVPCAYALARSRSRWARAFEEVLTLPVAVPGLATAIVLVRHILIDRAYGESGAGVVLPPAVLRTTRETPVPAAARPPLA